MFCHYVSKIISSPQVEFGKATDSGYWDGKVIERVRNPYLKRYKVEAALAAVQSSHQRAAFVMNAELGHSLQTQGGLGRFTKPGLFSWGCFPGDKWNILRMEVHYIQSSLGMRYAAYPSYKLQRIIASPK